MGNYKNPFEFRRHWDVPAAQANFLVQNREQFLEEKLNQLERTLQLVIERNSTAASSKGKGRGKRSNNQPGSSFLNRLRNFQPRQPSSSSENSDSQDEPPPYSERDEPGPFGPPGPVVTKRIFIKKVELLLNGAPLGKFKEYSNAIKTTLKNQSMSGIEKQSCILEADVIIARLCCHS